MATQPAVGTAAGTGRGMRDRFRGQVRDEVKAAALRQLADGGPQAVSINSIARELGVTGPALYRYVTGREQLLEALALDAYTDLAAALRAAGGRRGSPAARLRAVAHAYRRWALDQPHRYRLLFAPAAPGADAHTPALVEAASASLQVLVGVLTDLAPRLPVPGPPALREQLDRLEAARGGHADPGLTLVAVSLWCRLHGLVGIELGGNTASMGLDAALLLDSAVDEVLDRLGGPAA